MKQGDKTFDSLVTVGVVIAFIISALLALLVIGLLGLAVVWAFRGLV